MRTIIRKAEIDLHVWEVVGLELADLPPAVTEMDDNDSSSSSQPEGRQQDVAAPDIAEAETPEVFICLKRGAKELGAFIKGKVAEGLPPGALTDADLWQREGDTITLTDEDSQDAKVIVTPVKPDSTIISYSATDRQNPATKQESESSTPVKIKVTVVDVNINEASWPENQNNNMVITSYINMAAVGKPAGTNPKYSWSYDGGGVFTPPDKRTTLFTAPGTPTLVEEQNQQMLRVEYTIGGQPVPPCADKGVLNITAPVHAELISPQNPIFERTFWIKNNQKTFRLMKKKKDVKVVTYLFKDQFTSPITRANSHRNAGIDLMQKEEVPWNGKKNALEKWLSDNVARTIGWRNIVDQDGARLKDRLDLHGGKVPTSVILDDNNKFIVLDGFLNVGKSHIHSASVEKKNPTEVTDNKFTLKVIQAVSKGKNEWIEVHMKYVVDVK